MVEKLAKLYNTLLTIEMKGKDTITMAQCLQFLENAIAEEMAKENEKPVEEVPKE